MSSSLEKTRDKIQAALDSTRRLQSNDSLRLQISKLRKALRNAEKAACDANMAKEEAVKARVEAEKAKEEAEKELADFRLHAAEAANDRGRKSKEVTNSDYNEKDNESRTIEKSLEGLASDKEVIEATNGVKIARALDLEQQNERMTEEANDTQVEAAEEQLKNAMVDLETAQSVKLEVQDERIAEEAGEIDITADRERKGVEDGSQKEILAEDSTKEIDIVEEDNGAQTETAVSEQLVEEVREKKEEEITDEKNKSTDGGHAEVNECDEGAETAKDVSEKKTDCDADTIISPPLANTAVNGCWSESPLMGQVFTRNDGEVGNASIHFHETDGCYISYEKGSFSNVKLEDGSAFPSRIFFTEQIFNAYERTFTGVTDFGGILNGDISERYEIKFDCLFLCALSGICVSKKENGMEKTWDKYGITGFYTNRNLENVKKDTEERLRGEGASEKTIRLVLKKIRKF